jgi:hypothetical protein
LQKWDGS